MPMTPRSSLTLLLLTAASLALSIPRALAQESLPNLTTPGSKPTSSGLKVPAFDVASVKKNKSETHMMSIQIKPDGFACENISLKTLIGNAYSMNQDLIFGATGWIESQGFDVDAKVAGPDIATLKKLTPEERDSLLQPLLAERFHLKVHHETRMLPTYDLVLAKGGFKPKELPPVDAAAEEAKAPEARRDVGNMSMGPGSFQGQGITVGSLAGTLAYTVHHPVTDKTGLTGIYDVDLKWTPEDQPPDAGAEPGPSIFTALQEQLGLKLQPSKGPVDVLVIDHADPPSEN